MPQDSRSSPPPQMTWTKAMPVMAVALIFDALRLMAEFLWLLGPALGAAVCTAYVSDKIGTTVGGAACAAGASVVGFYGSPAFSALGVVMAMAIGLLGWLTIGLWVLVTNSRLLSENAGTLWFGGSLLVSEVPFLGAIPALTGTLWRLYSAQIKSDKEKIEKYAATEAVRRPSIHERERLVA